MRKININSENYDSEKFDINGLKEIKSTEDLEKISNFSLINISNGVKSLNLDGLEIDKYSDGIYVLKMNGKNLAYVKGKENLQTIFDEIKEKYSIEVGTKLKAQVVETEVKNNPKIPNNKSLDYIKKQVDKYEYKTLINMYNNTKDNEEKNNVLDIIYTKIKIDNNFTSKMKFLKSIKGTEIYDDIALLILSFIRNEQEKQNFIEQLGFSGLKEVIENNKNKDFLGILYTQLNMVNLKTFEIEECDGDTNDCNAFVGLAYSLKQYSGNNNFYFKGVFDILLILNDNKVDGYSKKVEKMLSNIGKEDLYTNVVKNAFEKGGVIGLCSGVLNSTTLAMTGGDIPKEGVESMNKWNTALCAVAAIFILFKTIYKIGKKVYEKGGFGGLIFAVMAANTASRASFKTNGLNTILGALAGGLNMGDAKKFTSKLKEFENKEGLKEYLTSITVVSDIFGDDKFKDIKGYIKFGKDGKVKGFDVDEYINSVDDEGRKEMLKKTPKDRLEKIIVDGLNSIGINSKNKDNSKYQDLTVLELSQKSFNILQNKLTKKQSTKKKQLNKQELDPVLSKDAKNQKEIKDTNDEEVILRVGTLETKKETVKTHIFRNVGKMEEEIDKIRKLEEKRMKAKLGIKLYNEVNEKLKLIGNLQEFYYMLSKYAKLHEYDGDWDFTFKPFYDFIDEKDQFIDGASDTFENSNKGLLKLTNYIIEAALAGDKDKLRIFLKGLDDANLQNMIDNVAGMVSLGGFGSNEFVESKQKILDMLKNGNSIDIATFFANNLRETSFVESMVFKTVYLNNLDLDKIIDRKLEDATDITYDTIKKGFYIGGKKISIKELDKDDVKSILKEVRGNEELSREQKKQYLQILLIGKVLYEEEDSIKSIVSGNKELKKLYDSYYKHNSSWDKFKDHWASNLYKGAIITLAMIATDGMVAGLFAEGAKLGLAYRLGKTFGKGVSLIPRAAVMHNVAGNMSLFLNDQWSLDKSKDILLDTHGYAHTAALLLTFEILPLIPKWLKGGLNKLSGNKYVSGGIDKVKELAGKIPGAQHVSGGINKMKELGTKIPGVQYVSGGIERIGNIGNERFNLRNFTLIGIDVAALLGKVGIDTTALLLADKAVSHYIDGVEFNGEFTADEIMNALMFAFVMRMTGRVEISKSPNGEIRIEEISIQTKGEFREAEAKIPERKQKLRDRLDRSKALLEQEKARLEAELQQKEQRLEQLERQNTQAIDAKKQQIAGLERERDIKKQELRNIEQGSNVAKQVKEQEIINELNRIKLDLETKKLKLEEDIKEIDNPLGEVTDRQKLTRLRTKLNKVSLELKNVKQMLKGKEPYAKINSRPKFNRLVDEWSQIGDKSRVEAELQSLESELQVKNQELQQLEQSAKTQDIIDLETEIAQLKSEISNINSKIAKIEVAKLKLDDRYLEKLNKKIDEILFNRNQKVLLSEVEASLKNGKDFTMEIGDASNPIKIEVKDGKIILTENGNATIFEKFSKFEKEFKKLTDKIDKSKLTEYVTKKQVEYMKKVGENIEYTKPIGDEFKIPKKERILKVGDKKYTVAEKKGEYYIIEKEGKNIYKLTEVKQIDEFLNEHPEVVDGYYQEIYKKYNQMLEKLDNVKVSNLNPQQQKQVASFLGKPLSKIKDWTFGDIIRAASEYKQELGNTAWYKKPVKALYMPVKWLLTGKVKPGESVVYDMLEMARWRNVLGFLLVSSPYILEHEIDTFSNTENKTWVDIGLGMFMSVPAGVSDWWKEDVAEKPIESIVEFIGVNRFIKLGLLYETGEYMTNKKEEKSPDNVIIR